jgi:zinc/manganese transport system substrate-binding protein
MSYVRPAGRQRRRRRRGGATTIGLLAAALVLSACNAPAAVSSGKLRAVGAENQYANVIAQIGGRFVSVDAVMSNPNTDPHTFEASTSVAQEIASAQLVVQNGVGYDTFMQQLESSTPSSSRHVIDVQKLLGLSLKTKNPHLWYDPKTMPAVATVVAHDLSSLAPTHAAYFDARLKAFLASLQPVAMAIKNFKARFGGVAVATTEPVADYLLSALGLDNVTPFRFQADIMNGVDPSPEDIAFQQNLFTGHRAKVFVYNAQVSSTVTVAMRQLAESSHVPVVAVYETMPTPGFDYQTWMLAEIAALTKALTTHVSTKELT